MSLFTTPVLPQNDTPENRAKRAEELVQKQSAYQYDYPAIVGELPMAKAPFGVDLSVDWTLQVAQTALGLVENLIDILVPDHFSFDIQIPIQLGASGKAHRAFAVPARDSRSLEGEPVDDARKQKATELHDLLEDARGDLTKIVKSAQDRSVPSPNGRSLGPDVQGFVEGPGAARLGEALAPSAALDLGDWIGKLVKKILDAFLSLVGLYGRATDLRDYDAQFTKLPLPWPAGVYQTDAIFAELRVAGFNPGILRRATAQDLAGFPATDEAFRKVTDEPEASLREAVTAGRLYLVDYQALTALTPGTIPQQKYVFTPKALFFVPGAGNGRRALRPFAIQSGQAADSPIFYADGSLEWNIAKLTVNIADGNYHELISHLGLTHLLTEPFALATERQLDPQHPLNLLLMPHFAGTLLINYAAQTTLITEGGPIDKLLAGTITSSDLLAASSVRAVRYNQSFFPHTLEARGVADREALPDYPYRDDALANWNAIHAWVSDYVAIYYSGDVDVAEDYELQAWVQELSTQGQLQDIGEGGKGAEAAIATVAYLARLLTQVIFTASVEHAAVNFPQRTIMAYTPAVPLAGYAPFPAAAGAPATQALDVLPPLNQSILQQAVAGGLGSVYHTALGQYGGQLSDLRALIALQAFQTRLHGIEKEIHAANALGGRTTYITLLPSAIPQSINI